MWTSYAAGSQLKAEGEGLKQLAVWAGGDVVEEVPGLAAAMALAQQATFRPGLGHQCCQGQNQGKIRVPGQSWW